MDSGNWDLWPGFVTDDCVDRLQPRENHARGSLLATLAFTGKCMRQDRVYGIRETLFHAPCDQRHIVGTPVLREAATARWRCEPIMPSSAPSCRMRPRCSASAATSTPCCAPRRA